MKIPSFTKKNIPVFITLLAGSLFISSGEKKTDADLPFLAAVDKMVEDQMAKQEIFGCAVGVVQNGNIVHIKGYGHLDRLRTKVVNTNTIFRWASISKTLTATAVFKAIEENKMSLADKVTKHVSYWSTSFNKDDITIAQLMNHRSGILHYGFDQNNNKICNYNQAAYKSSNNYNAEQSVAVFKNCNLAFVPGNNYLYTTFGYNLLGAALEEATNLPYEKYVKAKITDKMGIKTLTAYSSDPGGYDKDCNGFIVNKTEGKVEWKLPGGGWASNIQDLTKFMQGLINGVFLSNTSALWQPVSNNNNYSFGISRGSLGGETYVWHSGAHDDVRTYLGFFPSSKLGVTVMINGGDNVSAARIAKKVEEVLGKNWNIDDRPVNYCDSTKSCNDNMTGVWRKTGDAENIVIRKGYNTAEFNAEWKWLLDKGYYCADIETYMKGATRRWDGIFKKTNKKSAMWRNFNLDDFNKKWKEMNDAGYRLIDIETYMDGTTRKWAGVFLEMSGAYALHRNMSHQQMHDRWEEYGKKGLKLIDIERYGNDWAGVWIAGEDVAMYRNFETNDFRDKRRELNDKGWKLIDVETYMDGGKRKWAGLWEKTSTAEHYIYGPSYCDWLRKYHDDYDNDGYELIDMETY